MAAGWIGLKREIWDNPLWLEDAPFDNRSAYIDMLLQAGYKDKKVIISGIVVSVGWGSFVTSQDKLSKRWNWGRQKVRDYLKLLEKAELISIESNKKYTVITMLKDLQKPTEQPSDNQQNNQQTTTKEPSDNQVVTNRQPTDNQQTTTTNKDNNIYNINNINNTNKGNKENKATILKMGDLPIDENNPFYLWEHWGFGTISHGIAEALKALIEETSEYSVCEAIKIAGRNNAKRIGYVETVAKRIASGQGFVYKGAKTESIEDIANDLEREMQEGAFWNGDNSQYSDNLSF